MSENEGTKWVLGWSSILCLPNFPISVFKNDLVVKPGCHRI